MKTILIMTLSFFATSLMLNSCLKEEVSSEQPFVKADAPSDGSSGSSSSDVLFFEHKSAGFVEPKSWYESKCTIKENGDFEYRYKKINQADQVVTGQIPSNLIIDMQQYIEEILQYELYKVDNIHCRTDGPLHTTEVLSKGSKHFINVTDQDFSSGNCVQIDIECQGSSTDKLYEIVRDHCKL